LGVGGLDDHTAFSRYPGEPPLGIPPVSGTLTPRGSVVTLA
jgi:hypothetical protein